MHFRILQKMHGNGGVDEAWLAKMFPSKCGGDCYIECCGHGRNLLILNAREIATCSLLNGEGFDPFLMPHTCIGDCYMLYFG